MSKHRVFLLDSNVFIESHQRHYTFGVCPGFWESLIWHHGKRRLYSLDRVCTELEQGKDYLTKWCSKLPAEFFRTTDDKKTIAGYADVQEWVQAQPQFLPAAKAHFAAGADGWLVAEAAAYGLVLVTQEAPAPSARKIVPIPTVCDEFDVPWINTFEMLKEQGVRLHWKPPA